MQEAFPNTPFQAWLEKRNACEPARMWVGSQTLAEAWATCERPDWMLWLVCHDRHLSARRTQLVRLAVAFARRALWWVPEGEDRPRACIETVERWLEGAATIEEVRAARDAVDVAADAVDAAADARAAAAVDAADAAADAADAAADAAAAAHAAYAAAHAAAHAARAAGGAGYATYAAGYAAYAAGAAADVERRAQCDLIRAEIRVRGAK